MSGITLAYKINIFLLFSNYKSNFDSFAVDPLLTK